MPTKTIASCFSVSCMDPRERIVEARFSKMMHLADALDSEIFSGEIADRLREIKKEHGISRLELAVNFYRNARGGGGWSSDARADLQTIKDNGLPVMAVYSTRHRQCAAIKVDQHIHDQDVAVMIVEDFNAVGLELPPVFRAHLEVVSKHEEFDREPMDIEALVAYALVHGVSKNFPAHGYDPKNAAKILKIDTLQKDELAELAKRVSFTSKGLLLPKVELEDEPLGH